MKKLLAIVIVLLAAILMVLTCPSKEAHKEAMLAVVEEYVQEESQSKFGTNLFARVGQNVIVRTVKLLLDTQLKEHNYYVLNTTSIKLGDKEKTLSVGVLGHVFTFDKEMLRENIEPLLKSKGKQDD